MAMDVNRIPKGLVGESVVDPSQSALHHNIHLCGVYIVLLVEIILSYMCTTCVCMCVCDVFLFPYRDNSPFKNMDPVKVSLVQLV